MVDVTVETAILQFPPMEISWLVEELQTVKLEMYLKIVLRISGSLQWKNTETTISLQSAVNVN